MPDKWVAECLACKWEEAHDSQLGAIEATTNHVFERHRDVAPELRAEKKIGHVQLRTVSLSPPEQKESAGPPQQEQLAAKPEEPVASDPAESSLADSVRFPRSFSVGGDREGF